MAKIGHFGQILCQKKYKGSHFFSDHGMSPISLTFGHNLTKNGQFGEFWDQFPGASLVALFFDGSQRFSTGLRPVVFWSKWSISSFRRLVLF